MKNSENQTRSAQGAVGIANRYITSQQVFELESKAIFGCHWLCVARIEELDSAGQCLPFQVENQQLFLVRAESGHVHAFRNFCRHRGCQLVNQDNCKEMGKRIQCPYHAWTYERSGELASAPNMTDVKHFESAEHGLIKIECQIQGGFVWINFSPSQRLDQWLQPIGGWLQDWNLDQLRIAHTINYNVKANWKLIFQNYNECYHCPTVHPILNRLTPYRGSSNDLEQGPILGGPMSLSEDSETMSSDGKSVGLAIPGLNRDQSRSVYYFTVFPTMFLSLHPDYVLVHRLERVDVENTKVVCQFLFHPDAIHRKGFDPGRAVEFWDLTNRQDWEVCELTQIGMGDPGYVPGPYSNLESVVAAFDRNYLATLGSVDGL